MKIIDITHKNQIENIKDLIIAVQISTLGAMGDSGAINFITKDKTIYYTNMEDELFSAPEIIEMFPSLKSYKNIFGIDEKQFFVEQQQNNNWKLFELGFGNYLFICKELQDNFEKAIKNMPIIDIFSNYEKIIENLL